MANLINNQFNSLRLEINYNDYWDFFLNNEPNTINYADYNGKTLYDKCLISFIDATDKLCFEGDDLVSKEEYSWDNVKLSDVILKNIGFTGVDNGLIHFERDRVSSEEFIDIYQDSTLELWQDGKLRLHQVKSPTKLYDYPISIEKDKIKLNGGFYQGFFKTDCAQYQILPDKLENGDIWQFEFVLNKTEFEKKSNKTLNDKYPNNKGIFFYLGTRAENKWVYLYDWDEKNIDDSKIKCFENPNVEWEEDNLIEEDDSLCENRCCMFAPDYVEDIEDDFDYLEDEIDTTKVEFKTNEGFIIGREKETFLDTDNKFLLFDRTCEGYTTDNYKEGDKVRYIFDNSDFNENLFLLMNRTCDGYTTDNIDELRKSYKKEYNIINDIVENAIAFRITDDGRIGYRYIVRDCDSETSNYKIIEGYSKEGIITEKQWYTINVRLNGFLNTMSLEFYVDGKLVFLTNEMPKLNLRKLNDIDEKQESVPFNISLGGGTQGLCDTILPNYMLNPYRVYPLEEHFGGSFIGYIKKFRFYNCKMNFNEILNNYRFENQDN